MAFTKYLLPALAVAQVALAQSSCSGTTTITAAADATGLSSCTTWKGDVIVDAAASGQIALDGVGQITGDLRCENAGSLTELSADQLGTIGGTFFLNNLTIMSTLAFSSLNNVQSIAWTALPALQGLNFPQGVSMATNVGISNTQLNTLSGIELETVEDMYINNNPYLATVNVNTIVNITGSLNFAANSRDLAVTFDNLLQANNLTFINVSSVSMPSLNVVNGSLGFYSDTFQSFSAPNLTQTGGALAFVDCPNLSNISMPSLKGIGAGFLIANNTNLKSLEGFPELQVVVGAIDFTGEFNNLTLPALKDVRGGFNMQTTSSTFNCAPFQGEAGMNNVIKGVFNCQVGKSNPDPNSSGTATGSSGSSSSTSKSSASNFDPTTPLTGLGALVAALLMI